MGERAVMTNALRMTCGKRLMKITKVNLLDGSLPIWYSRLFNLFRDLALFSKACLMLCSLFLRFLLVLLAPYSLQRRAIVICFLKFRSKVHSFTPCLRLTQLMFFSGSVRLSLLTQKRITNKEIFIILVDFFVIFW